MLQQVNRPVDPLHFLFLREMCFGVQAPRCQSSVLTSANSLAEGIWTLISLPLFSRQVSGEGDSGSLTFYHPVPDESQQSESVHAP